MISNVVLRLEEGLMKAGALLLQKMAGLKTSQVSPIDLALHAVTVRFFNSPFGASDSGRSRL